MSIVHVREFVTPGRENVQSNTNTVSIENNEDPDHSDTEDSIQNGVVALAEGI